MNRKFITTTVIAAIVAGVILIFSANRPLQAQSGIDPALMSKLDQILNYQKTMMQDISSMRDEMRIIKIRVTQSQ
jgi:hypothetical protein